MKRKNYILFLILIVIETQSYGQNIKLTGVVLETIDPIAFSRLTLKKIGTNITFNTITDFTGHFQFDSLVNGHYSFSSKFQGFNEYYLNDLFLVKDTNIQVYLIRCDSMFPITNCPACHQVDQVIRVGNDGILEIREPWGNQNPKYRFSRNIRKQGYETYDFVGQVLLYYVVGENSTRLYSENTLCDHLLFCKRDKTIFKSYAP